MPEASSKSCQISNQMMRHIENIFRNFQAYSGSSSNIPPFSGTLRDIKAY